MTNDATGTQAVVGYPYCRPDMVMAAEMYKYSPYRGRPFLEGYLRDRAAALARLPAAPAGSCPPADAPTLALLEAAAREVAGGDAARRRAAFEGALPAIHAYVATRGVPSGRAPDDVLRPPPLHALHLLAEVLAGALRHDGDLRTLDALLKVHDHALAAARFDAAAPASCAAGLRRTVAAEVDAVRHLCAQRGVAVPA